MSTPEVASTMSVEFAPGPGGGDGGATDPSLLGVSRHQLLARALEEIPAALHEELEAILIEPQGRVVHHGLVMDRLVWRARWRRTGWPSLSGPLAVHGGCVF